MIKNINKYNISSKLKWYYIENGNSTVDNVSTSAAVWNFTRRKMTTRCLCPSPIYYYYYSTRTEKFSPLFQKLLLGFFFFRTNFGAQFFRPPLTSNLLVLIFKKKPKKFRRPLFGSRCVLAFDMLTVVCVDVLV